MKNNLHNFRKPPSSRSSVKTLRGGVFSFLVLLSVWLPSDRLLAQCYQAPNYCTAISATNNANYGMGVQNVKLGTTPSPLQVNNTTASGNGTQIYFDYTNLIVRAAASDTIYYSVQVGNSNSTTFRIYIDYNNDGTFATTAPELVYTSAQVSASGIVNGNFVIPSTQQAGVYRIRIASDGLTNIPSPCGPTTYSAEYEDYTLLVPALTADVMSGRITQPAAPIVGNNAVAFTVTNISTSPITSLDIFYQFDNGIPVSQSLSSISIAPGATYTANFSTPITINAAGTYSLKAWTGNANFSSPNTPGNDTICRTIVAYCSGPLSGTYTINPAFPNGSANFRTWGAADSALASCGVNGPTNFNVTPGIYNEGLIFTAIPGASAVNKVIFYGNGSTLNFNCDATNLSVLRLQGVKHLTFDSVTFRSTNVNYGWGVHFYNNCDSNVIRNCTIDLSLVTTSSSTNSAGIVFSNSLTSPTTTGNTCVFNTIQNNYLKGNPTAASMYYGIVGFPAASSASYTNNRFINNRIENFYYYGIYWGNGNRTVFRKNLITRPTKTSVTTTYAFYLQNGSQSDTIDGNRITNLFGASPTNTNTTYLFWAINYSGTSALPNIWTNNQAYDIRGDGQLYGFYFLTSFNNRILNNTLLFDNTSSTNGSATTYGLYFTGNTSTTSFLDFRNNIMSFTRTGASTKYALYTTGAWTTGLTMNRNAYYSNSPNYKICNYVGVDYATLTNWKAASFLPDQNSIDYAPNFVNAALGNLSPQDGAYAGSGDTLVFPISKVDYNGTPRSSSSVDIGSVNASPIAVDAAMANVVLPVAPYAPGSQAISARIRNAGTTTVTTATINWSVNGVAQTPVSFNGSLAGGALSAPISLGNVTVAANTLYDITVTVTNPNSQTDPNTANNSITATTAAMVSGTVTVNQNGSGPGIIKSFTDLGRLLQIGGLGGAVTANVVTGSGPYNEQVFFSAFPGSSAVNTVTINGNGEVLRFDNTSSGSIGVLNLTGATYVYINNLTIRTLNASYGVGIIFTGAANYNRIQNCTIDVGSVTGSSSSAGIAFTSALNSPTASGSNNGMGNLIENNLITGNSTGGPYYGISYLPNNTINGTNTFNIIRNNNIRDFTIYGFYVMYSAGSTIANNTIWRPTKSSPSTFYGFYCINGLAQDTFDANIIKSPFKMLETTTNTFYGYYLSSGNSSATRPAVFRNNQMYDIRSAGAVYGFYQVSSPNILFLNNLMMVDHPTSTSTSTTYLYYNSGTPTTTTLRNNIWFLNRGGSGSKYVYYLATTGAGYVINNNVVTVKQAGTNNFFGYYAANQSTFAAWKTVNTNAYDQNSTPADPMFRTYIGPEYFMPGSDSVNNIGFSTPIVPRDILGSLRSATPDPGPYEFSVPAADAALTRITSPLSPLSLGTQNVNVTLKSFGTTTLYNANIGWQVNGTNQSPVSWFGNLNYNDSTNYTLGSYFFNNPGFYRIKAWSYGPNGQVDSFPQNDTVNITVCTPLQGNYTVNPALPATDTNFVSVASFVSTVTTCGVSGPITVQVAPGTYNGALTFGSIPGISGVNNITINGADSATTKIVHDGSVQRATIVLNGAKYITFRNISIEATALSGGGYGVLLMNAADSNRIIRSSVKVAVLTTGLSAFAPIVSTANLLNVNNAGNNANYLLVDSCRLVGGYYSINLYNNSSPKANGNVVSNSVFVQPYYYGAYMYWQNGVKVTNNRIEFCGNNINTFSSPIYVYQSDNGIQITKNQSFGQMGGYGVYLSQNNGTATTRNILANNMFQIGTASNTSYGIYDAGNIYLDIAHNTVHNTSGDASYVSTGIYINYANSATANNARIVNNVFSSPNGAMAVWCTNTAVLNVSSMLINNNVYYSPSSYPFRIVNTIYNALPQYRAAMGTFITNCDSASVWAQPAFFSNTNLRSITPQLDSIGMVIATVTDDIDGNPRSTNAPDAGVYEFSRPSDDAGVVAILDPQPPVAVGKRNVRVVIRNFGLNTMTNAMVTFKADTIIRTRAYFGSIVPGGQDTVLFDSTSGPGGTDQRLNYYGGAITLKAYTTLPNGSPDVQNLNDTTMLSFCAPLSGTYTINPAGSGTNNFLTIGDAVNRLTCGGVTGNVVFNIASGTYTGQVDINTIYGVNDSTRVLFRSATGNAADVILTSNNSTSIDNFTVRLRGASYVTLDRLTIRNTNATFGRVVSINKLPSNNTNSSNIAVRNCVLEGINTTSTADQYTIVFGPGGDNATNLSFVSNTIRYGSYGIYIGGQNIINLFSPGLVIDSNNFVQPYYASVYLLNRKDPKVRANYLDGNPSYGYYGIFLSSVSGDVEVNANNLQSVAGYYGVYLAQCNYYGEPGVAKVTNNVVNMTSVNTQYGIYFVNGSATYFINNTVRCNAPTTATYAFYFSGNTTSVTTPQIVATNNVRVYNNIFWSQLGYASYFANFNAVAGTPQCNNNLYYSGGTNFAYINGTNYAPGSIYSTFRNAVHSGSDRRSLHVNLAFTSNTLLRPLVTDQTAWAASGRGQQSGFVNTDITGAARSTQVNTGAPDIGAYEFTPTSTPVAATLVGSIGQGNTQSMIVYGDTIGKIVWGYSGVLPSAITATYHTGVGVSDPTNGGRNAGAHYMDVFWRITATGGSYYNYDLTLNFDPNMLGTVPSLSDIKLAKKQTGVNGTWTHYGSTLTSVDTINYNFGVLGLSDFSDFTGTSDFAPLPVVLNKFEALRENENALLYWNTASEKNSDRFEVQRATDGENFETIGKVTAAGNSTSNHNYIFTDEGAAIRFEGSRAYYRLKMVDRDGQSEFSPVRVVDFTGNHAGDVTVYPNPFRDMLTVSLNEINGNAVQVEIFDLNGKVWFSGSQMPDANHPEVVIPSLNKLNAGIYLIRINDGSSVVTRKLVKE